MTLGPVQFLAIDFGPEAEFSGEIIAELNRLYDRGSIRVLDVAVVRKTEEGEVVSLRVSEFSLRGSEEVGEGVKKLLGIGSDSDVLQEAAELIQPALLAEVDTGLVKEDLQKLVDDLENGQAISVVLFEHTWATRFAEIVRLEGGSLRLQGFLTDELTGARGADLAAISDAAASIEMAEAVIGASYLDALRSLEGLQHLKSAIAAETVRMLMVAGLMPDEVAEEAIDTLYEAGLIEDAALDEADRAVKQMEVEVAEASAPAV